MADRYRVVEGHGPLGLRKSPDPTDPAYQEWFNWADGEVFTPPEHMRVDLALAKGHIERVGVETVRRGRGAANG